MPRRTFDFHETPVHYLTALSWAIGKDIAGKAYAPCVGTGAIPAHFTKLRWRTNDWDPKRVAHTHYNATRPKAWGTLGYDWCIENPPFEVELPIVQHALQWCKNVAVLARLSFLEPTKDRTDFWRRHADSVHVIMLPRYSFRLNDDGNRGSDNMTCCWLVWALHVKPGISWSQFRE